MPISLTTKNTVGRSRLTNYSIPNPNPDVEAGGTVLVPRAIFYDNGVRTVPVMHRAFKNLEEKYASALVAAALAVRGGTADSLRVLDIGYGLGYSTQKFFELGVGTYHCVEINDTIYWNDAVNHNYFPGGIGAIMGDYQMIFDSWENYVENYFIERPDPNVASEEAPRNPGYDIIYYSPCDDFGNMALFNKLRLVSKNGAVLGIQGIPLFDEVSLGQFVMESPAGTAPDLDTFDSNFTYSMYTALNNKGYFSVYYQYYNCMSGGFGGLFGSTCSSEGTWGTNPPSGRG